MIYQNDRMLILHVAAHSVFMAIFLNPKFSSGAVCTSDHLVKVGVNVPLRFCYKTKQSETYMAWVMPLGRVNVQKYYYVIVK